MLGPETFRSDDPTRVLGPAGATFVRRLPPGDPNAAYLIVVKDDGDAETDVSIRYGDIIVPKGALVGGGVTEVTLPMKLYARSAYLAVTLWGKPGASATVVIGLVPSRVTGPSATDVQQGFGTGRIVTKYRAGILSPAELAAINLKYGLVRQEYLPAISGYLGFAFDANGQQTLARIQLLSVDPAVASVGPDVVRSVDGAGTTMVLPTLTELGQEDRESFVGVAWAGMDIPGGLEPGAGAVVAFLDTGIDYLHPEISTQILDKLDLRPGFPKDPTDDQGHGTAVAGVIAAISNQSKPVGGAYGTKVISLRVLDATSGFMSSVYDAWDFVLNRAQQIDVVNYSMTGPVGDAHEAQLIRDVVNAGVLVVASAGNGAIPRKVVHCVAGTVGYPARMPEVVAVGGYRQIPGGWDNPFDCRGPEIDVLAFYKAETMTPLKFGGRVFDFVGTSASAPQVAAAAAMLKSIDPTLRGPTLRAELMKHVVPMVDPSPWNVSAVGRLWLANISPLFGSLTVHLADQLGRSVIADVTVLPLNGNPVSMMANGSGDAFFSKVLARAAKVTVSNPPSGCTAPGPISTTVTAGTTTSLNIPLNCGPGGQLVTVTGSVTSPQRGPLPGVQVSSSNKTNLTDAAGGYVLTGIPVGAAVSLTGLPPGCPDPGSKTVGAGQQGNVLLDFPVACSVTVSGTVTSPQRGPLPNVTVTYAGQSTITTATGSYTLTATPTALSSVGLSQLLAGCTNPGSQTVPVVPTGAATRNFVVPCSVTVSGTVTSPQYGPLPNVPVMLAGQVVTTSATGAYTVTATPPGPPTVALGPLRPECSDPGSQSPPVLPNGNATANFVVMCTVTVSGTVSSLQRGPLAGIEVSIGSVKTLTLGNGTYSLIVTPVSAFLVTLGPLPPGCTDPGAQTFSLPSGPFVLADFPVPCTGTTGSIAGRVASLNRGVLPNVVVSAAGRTATTDAGGQYTLTAIPAGQVDVSVSSLPTGCTVPASQRVTVTAGAQTSLDFTVTCTFDASAIFGQYLLTAYFTSGVDGGQTTLNSNLTWEREHFSGTNRIYCQGKGLPNCGGGSIGRYRILGLTPDLLAYDIQLDLITGSGNTIPNLFRYRVTVDGKRIDSYTPGDCTPQTCVFNATFQR